MDENKAFELNDDALDTIVGGTGSGRCWRRSGTILTSSSSTARRPWGC